VEHWLDETMAEDGKQKIVKKADVMERHYDWSITAAQSYGLRRSGDGNGNWQRLI
jgi:hypothetical protein